MDEHYSLERLLDAPSPFDWSDEELHTLLTIGQRSLTREQAKLVAEAYSQGLPSGWQERKQEEYALFRVEAQTFGLEPADEETAGIMASPSFAVVDWYAARTEPNES